MACNNTCKICPKAIYSNSVAVVSISGIETLVIDIPAGYYPNGGQYCLFIIQSIPATATIITMIIAVLDMVSVTTAGGSKTFAAVPAIEFSAQNIRYVGNVFAVIIFV